MSHMVSGNAALPWLLERVSWRDRDILITRVRSIESRGGTHRKRKLLFSGRRGASGHSCGLDGRDGALRRPRRVTAAQSGEVVHSDDSSPSCPLVPPALRGRGHRSAMALPVIAVFGCAPRSVATRFLLSFWE